MKDELKKGREKRKKESQINFRFLAFTAMVMAMFGVLVYGLFDLQMVKGDEYAVQTGKESIKSIAIKGSRGMKLEEVLSRLYERF